MFSAIEEHFLRIFRFSFMQKKKKKMLLTSTLQTKVRTTEKGPFYGD